MPLTPKLINYTCLLHSFMEKLFEEVCLLPLSSLLCCKKRGWMKRESENNLKEKNIKNKGLDHKERPVYFMLAWLRQFLAEMSKVKAALDSGFPATTLIKHHKALTSICFTVNVCPIYFHIIFFVFCFMWQLLYFSFCVLFNCSVSCFFLWNFFYHQFLLFILHSVIFLHKLFDVFFDVPSFYTFSLLVSLLFSLILLFSSHDDSFSFSLASSPLLPLSIFSSPYLLSSPLLSLCFVSY